MVRIRLRRVGSRNQPSYRIVAADKESPRDGKFLEILGHYNPRTEPSTVVVDEARLFHWMSNGAQPSDAVVKALRAGGTWERWDRFKEGEELETLLAEAEASKVEVDPRTRRDDLFGKRKKKAKKKAKEAAEQEAVEAESPPEEVEAEAEVETAEPTAEAEDPVEETPQDEGEEPETEAAESAEETAGEEEETPSDEANEESAEPEEPASQDMEEPAVETDEDPEAEEKTED